MRRQAAWMARRIHTTRAVVVRDRDTCHGRSTPAPIFHALPRIPYSTGCVSQTTSMRTHLCGRIDRSLVGETVELCGWMQNPRKLGGIFFARLRDHSGLIQVTVAGGDTQEASSLLATLEEIPAESVIRITGVVQLRPDGLSNPQMQTGDIEVAIHDMELLNRSDVLPVSIDSNEESRLQYRYLDLRSERLQRNIRLRSRITQLIRAFLTDQDFVEIETPTLFRATPEGAREFLVPTKHEGRFYALPQSPQQYKQLLMSSGFDRYFQLARCCENAVI